MPLESSHAGVWELLMACLFLFPSRVPPATLPPSTLSDTPHETTDGILGSRPERLCHHAGMASVLIGD